MKTLAVLVAALAALLIAAGCGGGDSETDAQPAPEPTVTEEPTAPEPEPAEPTQAPAPPPPDPPPEPDPPPAPEPVPEPDPAPPAPDPEPTPPPEEPPPELPAGLPEDIAGYETWILLNSEPIPPREGGDAHLGTKMVYSSDESNANGVYPDGTIIVKDANRPDKNFIGLVAIMRKAQGSNPDHNGWTFIEYARNADGEPFSELASGSVCTGCHVNAAASDYVWIVELGMTE